MTVTYDSSRPTIVRVEADATDEVLSALAEGRPFEGSADVDQDLLIMIAGILRESRGQLTLTTSDAESFLEHRIALAAHGLLRRTRITPTADELAISPTAVLPGVVLQLAGISPTEPLESDVQISLPQSCSPQSALTSEDRARTAVWKELATLAQGLPPATNRSVEATPGRLVRLARQRPEGEDSVDVFLLAGRYLLTRPSSFGTTLVGSDPTEVTRALVRVMLPRSA